MHFTMNTAKINSILGKVKKGVGSSKILPVTEFLKFELIAGTLSIMATDTANFIEHVEKNVEGEDGTAIVKADKLINLAAKTTKAQIEFTLKESYLEVKGNGTYKVELYDTNEYPSYDFNTDLQGVTVKTAQLKKAFAINKSAIAEDMLMPCLTGYNIGGDVVTTDGVKMCLNDTVIIPDQRALIPQALADLLSVLNTDELYIQKDDNKLLFTTEGTTIFGTELEGINEFPDISVVTTLEYPNTVTTKRQPLLDALDRLSLFTDRSTNWGIRFTFAPDALYIEDYKGKSTEKIEYGEKQQSDETVELVFNIKYLTDLLSAVGKDEATISYSADGYPLLIKDGTVLLALSAMAMEQE